MSDFAAFEYEGWQRVAHKYEAAWSGLTRGFIPKLVQAAEISKGQRVLDIACGPGYVSEVVSALGAETLGVDFSGEMIQLAKARSPSLSFVVGDAHALEVDSNAFDAALMNFGLLHLCDPKAAFQECSRVLRAGGCFGFSVWAGPEISPGARIVDQAIKEHANLQVSVPQGPDYFCYGRASDCTAALHEVGFAKGSVQFETVTSEWELPSATFLFECERYAGVRTAALLAQQSEDTLNQIAKQIEEAVNTFAIGDSFCVPFAAHIVTAKKPD